MFIEEINQKVEMGQISAFMERGNKVHHKLQQGVVNDRSFLKDYGVLPPYNHVWVAIVHPGGFIIPHIDAGGHKDRWHIPIQIAGSFWQDGELLDVTKPFQPNHYVPHAVWNSDDTPRIHIVCDRDVPHHNNPEKTPFVVTEMLPEVQELIDKI